MKIKSPLAPLLQRGELRAILLSYRLTSFFQTGGQQYAASASPFEKKRQQKHGSVFGTSTDLASPFVKGGLRGIFHCAIFAPIE